MRKKIHVSNHKCSISLVPCFLRSRGRKLSKEKNPTPFVFSPSSTTFTLYYCQLGLFGSGALHQAFFGCAGFLFHLTISILLLVVADSRRYWKALILLLLACFAVGILYFFIVHKTPVFSYHFYKKISSVASLSQPYILCKTYDPYEHTLHNLFSPA